MTSAEFLKYLQDAEQAADVALPLFGQGELVPVVTAAVNLILKIANAAQKQSGDSTIAASMAAARLAADVLEAQKFATNQ